MKNRFSKVFKIWNQRNTDFYKESFDKQAKENKLQFNFVAAFFNIMWLVFRKMYELAILFSAGFLAVHSAIITLCEDINMKISASIMFSIILFVCFGFFGNTLYNRHIKSQISKGYHKISDYNLIDPIGCVLSICLGQLFVEWIAPALIPNNIRTLIQFLVQTLIIAVLWAIDYKRFHLRESPKPIRVTKDSVNKYLEKSDSQQIGTAICIWFFTIFLLAVSAEISGRSGTNALGNRLNREAEETDKTPSSPAKFKSVSDFLQINHNSHPLIDEEDY